jgi:predicted nucleotidyltransferase component of viral defense system
MKFTPAQIRELAENTSFSAENLEKVLRLRELLIEFHKHTVLKGKLVLKGGTALNLFYLNLARHSVDIDLNYIGHADREATLKDRPDICKAVEQIAAGLGYQLQYGVDDYALREWYLNFTNYAARPDRIQVEINFLMRACALPPQELNAAAFGDAAPCRYPPEQISRERPPYREVCHARILGA